MNILKPEKRAAVIRALVEGSSVRATVRMTGVAKGTVLKLLVDLGDACAAFHDRRVRGLTTRRVQCDEIWSFVGAKAKNVPDDKVGVYGDAWTWTAIDAGSKVMISWLVGQRDTTTAIDFMQDVRERLSHRVQLTTDGHKSYLVAIDNAFGEEVDYAQLHKIYGAPEPSVARYSPAKCIGATKCGITGRPSQRHISTSYVERANLTMRMSMRRFTRLTNGFSKKYENLCHAVAIHFVYYNFVRPHQTLGMTPAMKAGISDRQWTIEDMVGLLADGGSN
jgi:IS1 family transposase